MQRRAERDNDILDCLIEAVSEGTEVSEAAVRRIDARLQDEASRRRPYALVRSFATAAAEVPHGPVAERESELDSFPTRIVLEPPYSIFRGLPFEPRQLKTGRTGVVSSFSATYPSEGKLELGAAVGKLGDVQHPTEPIAFPFPFPVGIRREEARLVGAIALPLPAGIARLTSVRGEYRVMVEATVEAPLSMGTDSYIGDEDQSLRYTASGAAPDGTGSARATLSLRVRSGGAEATDTRTCVRFTSPPPPGGQLHASGRQILRVQLRGRENVIGIELAAKVRAEFARSRDAFAGLDFRAQPTELEDVSTLSYLWGGDEHFEPFFVVNEPADGGAFVLSRLAIGIKPVGPRLIE